VKSYETVIVFDPTLEEERIGTKVADVERRIRESGGDVQATDQWGKRKLAYPIERKENGVFVLLKYSAPGARIAEIERALRLDETVLRHMTVVGPDEALVRRAAEAAEKAAQRRTRQQEEED
jgi:small subunit ribosomal protein S6